MINKARLREKLNRPCGHKEFDRVTELALAELVSREIPACLIPFTRPAKVESVRQDMEQEMQDMTWAQIEELAVQFEVKVEGQIDISKQKRYEEMEEYNG